VEATPNDRFSDASSSSNQTTKTELPRLPPDLIRPSYNQLPDGLGLITELQRNAFHSPNSETPSRTIGDLHFVIAHLLARYALLGLDVPQEHLSLSNAQAAEPPFDGPAGSHAAPPPLREKKKPTSDVNP
jgi:hypothetical protein